MSTYQVWTEGYAATGDNSGAQFHGNYEGESFKDAVIAFRDSIADERSKSLIDLDRLTYWGCHFFDNAAEAQKSFG